MKRSLAQGPSRGMTRLSSIDVPLAAAITAVPTILLVAQVPSSMLLPALAALAFMTSAAAAVMGWATGTPRNSTAVTIWDFAGACVLIGIAAGTFSEPVQISQLLGIATTLP
jgi:multidrug transporter EmrE-like cation transporter